MAFLLLYGGFGMIYPFIPLFLYRYAGLSKTQASDKSRFKHSQDY